MPPRSEERIITAAELANYVVCPEAWRLKYLGLGERRGNERTTESREIRAEWARKQDLSSRLSAYAKIAYILLVLLAVVVFVLEHNRAEYVGAILSHYHDADGGADKVKAARSNVPTEILSLILVLGLIIFMWDFFERRSRTLRKSSGLGEKAEAIAVKGSSDLPPKQYFSKTLGLKSKPDALAKEGNTIIPIDIHPLTNKIRDRHVVQLLVHLRLIEEIEGVRPEYGVLLMGKAQRQVHVKNSPEKQRWLETLIDEMRSIMDGVPAVPSPAPFKCKTCDVRSVCVHSVYREGAYRDGPPPVFRSTETEDDS
jgi:CRISPR/Cas system-associated exonuclease Cas4 (RecB family)